MRCKKEINVFFQIYAHTLSSYFFNLHADYYYSVKKGRFFFNTDFSNKYVVCMYAYFR